MRGNFTAPIEMDTLFANLNIKKNETCHCNRLFEVFFCNYKNVRTCIRFGTRLTIKSLVSETVGI